MIVNVTEVGGGGESVVLVTGTEEETGDTVTFGVDHRIAWDLQDRVEEWGEVPCSVEPWQVMGRIKASV